MTVSVTTPFFESLRAENHDLHAAALDHPVVRGIGDGTLDEGTFRFYVEQDYAFLRRYVRVLARAVDAAPDLPTAELLAALLHGTLAVEIGALRELYAEFGGAPGDLDSIVPAPSCQAYTDHLLARSDDGNLCVILAAVLPCQWGYGDIGRQLIADGLPHDPRYARWIAEYASEDYGNIVRSTVAAFDCLASRESERVRDRARSAFHISSHYELQFWNMAARKEQWSPVSEPA